jgi:predicted RNA-binding Zn-ribbon protein involved in translation (DUF1610 family)
MTIIKATCPLCGDVELTSAQVRLVLYPVPERSYYAFTCPQCEDSIRKSAGPEVVRLLKVGGVVPERIEVPAEATEVHEGPALTTDDLLDFAAWMAGATNIAGAAAVGLHQRLLPAQERTSKG